VPGVARRTIIALACIIASAACSSTPDVVSGPSAPVSTESPATTADDEGVGPATGETKPESPSPMDPPATEPSDDRPAEPTAPTAPTSPASSGDGIGDPLWPDLGNPGIDVLDYDVDLTYDPALDTIDGSVTLTVQATEDRPSFTLDSDGPDVTRVTVRGEDAAFSAEPPELRITPTEPLRTDEGPIEVVVEYSAAPDASNSAAGIPNGWFDTAGGSYVLNQPDGARSWLPSNDHPSDKASWTFRLTVPEQLTAVANGRLVEQTTSEGTATWTWREDLPMATYLVQVITGDYELVEAEGPNGLPLVSAVLRQDRATMQPYLDTIDDQIAFFETLFGPYPLDRYGIAITDSFPGLAMETFGRSLFSRDDFSSGRLGYVQELLLSHELAHQWFGDAVTPSQWGDIWLNESFATYGEWLWTDHVGVDDIDSRAADALARRQTGMGSPTGSPSAADMFDFNSYDGGAVVLHALRATIGDDLFFETLRRWVEDNEGTSRTTDDFIALAEEVSGQDLEAFFDAWLFADVPPPTYPL
jgi:aminopeptidase N